MLQTTDIIDIFKSPTNKKREVQWNPLMFPVGSSHSLDKSYFNFNFYVKQKFFFTLTFMLNPGTGKLFQVATLKKGTRGR